MHTSEIPIGRAINYVIGGGWGKGSPEPGTVPIRVIRGTDFKNIADGLFGAVPRRFETAKTVDRRRLEPGDIILEISGGSPSRNQATGRTLLVTQSILENLGEPAIPASFCRLVRFDKNVVDKKYAFYSLQEMYKSGRAAFYQHQSTGISNFQFRYFLDNEMLRLPSFSEQRAIAEVLGILDEKIELNRRMIEKTEEIARTLFKSWFVDFDPLIANMKGGPRRSESLAGLSVKFHDIFPDRLVESDMGKIPEGWEVTTVGEVADVTSGKRPRSRFSFANDEAHVPLWGGNGPMGFVEIPLVEYPILLTGRVGTLGSVFRISTPCWPSDNTLIVNAFTEHFLNCLYFQMERIDFDALNRGSTQPLLTQSDLKSQLVLLPPDEVLMHFDKLTALIFDAKDKRLEENFALAAQRDTLLPKLVSGAIKVVTEH